MRTKRTNYLIFPIICTLLLLGSCNDFLDEAPDNRVTLDNLDKATQLLTNAYSEASYGFTDWMSDDVSYTEGTTKRQGHEQMFEWKDYTGNPTNQDTPDYYWFENYEAIAHANEVLAILDHLQVSNDEDTKRKEAIEGEALLARAYHHFMLATLFCANYNPQETNLGLGIPYATTPEKDFIVSYERGTVEATHSAIEKDLLAGLEKVSDQYYLNSGKYHFTRNAALAFACRFYLFKWDMASCLKYANLLLGSNPASFIKDLNATEFQNAKSSIPEYANLYTSPDLPSNLLLMRKISLVQRTDFAYGPTSNFYRSLFNANIYNTGNSPNEVDERVDMELAKGENAAWPNKYPSLFERSSINSNVGYPYHIANVFTGEEALFNRIEANIYLNNLSDAIADLQIFMDRRYSGIPDAEKQLTQSSINNFIQSDNDQNSLLNFLLLEKRKEFLGMGLRWFDIRRYNFSVVHQTASGAIIRLDRNDPRKILQIPKSAIEVSGLEKNPR